MAHVSTIIFLYILFQIRFPYRLLCACPVAQLCSTLWPHGLYHSTLSLPCLRVLVVSFLPESGPSWPAKSALLGPVLPLKSYRLLGSLIVSYSYTLPRIPKSFIYEGYIYWYLLLEKTLESPLDCKEIKLVNPKGNPPWIFTGRTGA